MKNIFKDRVILKAYKKAAEGGNTHIQNELGVGYANGKFGLKKNPKEAEKWLKMAASVKDRYGLFNLGVLYIDGKNGIERNAVKAYKLIEMAMNKGHPKAEEALKEVYASMSPKEVVALKNFDWEAKKQAAKERGGFAITINPFSVLMYICIAIMIVMYLF